MNEILTLREAATLLRLHPETVRTRAKLGKIKGVQVGRRWRFLRADLIAWLRTRYPTGARTAAGVASNRRRHLCPSSAEVRKGPGISGSRHRVESEYMKLLGL
ncbi:MAG: helix-turn-helix domain-containing protein [Gammaproteobacteria bacterium]|nr:helix-turn-helix domain-containing protein [Gammaproteobacteria bacterium]